MAPVTRKTTRRIAMHAPTTLETNYDRFSSLLGNLPQELYDMIFELSLTIDKPPDPYGNADGIVTITEEYRPPAPLQLNSKIRRRALKDFYNNTTFEIHKTPSLTPRFQTAILRRWILSLPKAVVPAIHKIRYHSVLTYVYTNFGSSGPSLSNEIARGSILDLRDAAEVEHPSSLRYAKMVNECVLPAA